MSCFLMILPSRLQYTLKRVGPKTDPCGTPYLTSLQQERELLTFIKVVLLVMDIVLFTLPSALGTASYVTILLSTQLGYWMQ